MNMKRHLIAICATTLLAASAGWAASDGTHPTNTTNANKTTKPATMMGAHGITSAGEKDLLEQKLAAAQTRADYARILESNGYRIAAVNADKDDYLEYEVVKGQHSYEVQLDFDKGMAKASKIDVTFNMWRTDEAKRMLADASYRPSAPLKADPESRFSDRRYMPAWNDEKGRLEKSLTPNMKLSDIRPKLEQMGYKVTAVNDRESDYVEYEIVKGRNSYEVQIDVNAKTQVATKVDVTSNLWEADATDRVTDANKAMGKATR
jgi:hypothetical protein